jgi:hypothetical protein
MSPQVVLPGGATPDLSSEWMWTWNGISFGYRQGDSLFTFDGIEVGRFSGAEVYGVDGRYLGELRVAEDGNRLITNTYKKSRTISDFAPTFGRAYKRLGNRGGEPLYCGHEDFPLPQKARRMVVRGSG